MRDTSPGEAEAVYILARGGICVIPRTDLFPMMLHLTDASQSRREQPDLRCTCCARVFAAALITAQHSTHRKTKSAHTKTNQHKLLSMRLLQHSSASPTGPADDGAQHSTAQHSTAHTEKQNQHTQKQISTSCFPCVCCSTRQLARQARQMTGHSTAQHRTHRKDFQHTQKNQHKLLSMRLLQHSSASPTGPADDGASLPSLHKRAPSRAVGPSKPP